MHDFRTHLHSDPFAARTAEIDSEHIPALRAKGQEAPVPDIVQHEGPSGKKHEDGNHVRYLSKLPYFLRKHIHLARKFDC